MSVACVAALLSISLLAACGDNAATPNEEGSAGSEKAGDAGLGEVSVDADGGNGDAPPFSFAGPAASTSMEETFEEPAEEGEGTIVFADGREAEITFYTCYDFVPDRVSTGRGEVGLAFFGHGEMADGQRFEIEAEHRDGANVVTVKTTADPDRLAANTYPVWSSPEVNAAANGLSLDLRDFWLLATVFLKGAGGPEVISGPARISAAAAEESGTVKTQAEADELFNKLAAEEVDEGYAAKVERLTATCLDGG